MKRWYPAVLGVAAGLLAALIIFWHRTWHYLAYWTGSYDTPGVAHHYNFFSGSGSDITELLLIGGVVTALAGLYRKFNCHEDSCKRIGTHHVAGGKYSVCRKCYLKITGHPPDHKIDIAHLRRAHEAHEAQVAGTQAKLDEIHRHVSGQPGDFPPPA